MRGMMSLIVVNLSNNRLHGAIQAFEPFQKSAGSSFSGNAKLCSDPLDVDHGPIYGSNYVSDHSAFLGEVEISKLMDPSKGTANISAVAGKFGYKPLEYAYSMQVSMTGNMYIFGYYC